MLLLSFSILKAQSQYRSLGTGVTVDLSSASNWQIFSGGSWVTATTAPTGLASGSTLLIQAADTWANGATASSVPAGVTLTNKSNLIGAFTAGKITMSGTLVYAGNTAQVLPPSASFVGSKLTNLTIDNLAGVQIGTGGYTITGILYVQSGTFNTNNGGNSFTMSGTIQSGGGTINVGSFTTFTGISTLVNTDFKNSSIVGQLYRMNVGAVGNPGTISTSGAFTIAERFTLTSGTLTLGGPLSIKATGTKFTSSTDAGNIVAGNNAVSFDGTAQQSILASGFFANNTINNLVINNTTAGGAVSYPTSLTIGNSLTTKLAVGLTPLTVNGTATIGGALNISSFTSTPTLGQTFTVLSGTAISGTFSSVTLPTGYAFYTGVLDYSTPNIVKLTLGLATPLTPQNTSDLSLIMSNIRAGYGSVADNAIAGYLSTKNANGSWPDINYADHGLTWQPGNHWIRISAMCRAYSRSGSVYYGDPTIRTAIISAIDYWLGLSPAPYCDNWYQGTISLPKDIGTSIVAMRYGAIPLDNTREYALFGWMTKGRPLSEFAGEDGGSNQTDIAQNYMIRACLVQDPVLMNEVITTISSGLVIASNNGSTVGGGLQIDNSFTAHGPQLYIYGYGTVLVSGLATINSYINGSSYALTANQIALLSNFTRKGLIKATRGQYHDFNAFNRQISRPNEGKPGSSTISKIKALDLPQYATEYDNAINRLNGTQLPSYQVAAEHIHFWRTDYTVHHRSKYMFGLRSVSTRTNRSEKGNGENVKGYYVTDGANYIAVKGDEYYNIYPVWEWNKIPGTTIPETSIIPSRGEWATSLGKTSFVGGVSDGVYGVSTYAMDEFNTVAKKSWFFFDEEVVCLGAGINSTATDAINTTVNQCLLRGAVNVKTTSGVQTLANGSRQYTGNLQWAHQDSVGYFFPQGGNISLSNQAQTGSQYSINTNYSADPITKDVFKLWINHGLTPSSGSYAYIVAPGKSLAEMDTYNAAQLQIWANTDTLQAVYHAGIDFLQVVFYKPGTLVNNGFTITAESACTMLIKNLSTSSITVSVADPSQALSTVNITMRNTDIGFFNSYTATLPTGLMAGSSITTTLISENILPTVAITTPLTNTKYGAAANVTINANATDNDGISKVEFFQGATKLGEDSTFPYSFVWNNVAIGNYTITAKATDQIGAANTSAEVNVKVMQLTTDKFEAIGDAYVAGGSDANTNFPTGNLTVKNAAANLNRRAFIQFNLNGYASELDSAYLKLTVGSASATITSTTWEFYEVPDNNWTETNITWNNQKAIGNLIATVPGKVDGSTVLVPITATVLNKLNGDKKISVRITSTVYGGTTDARFVSKEHTDVNQRPTLILYGKIPNAGEPFSSSQQSTTIMQDNRGTKIALQTQNVLEVKVYPNPSSEYFSVLLPNENNEKTQLRLIDLSGRVVKAITNIPGNTVQFGQELTTGVYLLEVKDGDKRSVVKLIKL